MKCINELKKIGVEKIASKTRITQDKVQNILNLNYGAFNKAHARGFKQIIEREFGVDLSEWMEAFDAFHSAPAELLEQNDEKNINIIVEGGKKDKSMRVLIALLAVLVVFFISFFAYNNFIKNAKDGVESSEFTESNAESGSESNAESGEFADSAGADSTDSADLAKDSTDSTSADSIDSTNADSKKSTQNTIKIDTDSAKDSAKTDSTKADSAKDSTKADSTNATNIANIATAQNLAQITISANEPLWVGIIDLDSHKKQQFSIAKNRTISLDGDKIIRTGHSFFGITAPNLNKQFLGGNHTYFLYTSEKGVREISHDEFLGLNGGVEW